MGGCCAKMVECGKGITAYGTMMFVNYTIFAMGLVMVSLGIYSLTTYGEDSFFSRDVYALMIVFGLMTFGLVYLACIGGRDPRERPNYIFCYWCLISILLIGNSVGFFYFKTFIRGIDSTDSGSGGVSDALRTSAAKEFQDFILSTYTTCCTGCDKSVLDACVEDLDASEKNGGETFCNNSIVNNGTNVLAEGDCFFAEPCSQEQLADQFSNGDGSTGLGLGCYTFLKDIPGFDVSTDTCSVLKDLEVNGEPLVGPASNGKSCGRGDPKVYVDNVVQYFDDHYYLVAVPWGFLIALLSLGWVSSVFMIVWFSGGRNKNPAA